MQHTESVFSGIWSDMAIETTYMRFGHGPVGVVGKTLKPETLKVWAYSQSACTKIVSDLEEMNGRNKNKSEKHKEEENSQIKEDAKDRSSLRAVLSNYIHPLDPKQHPTNNIVNIVTGQVCGDTVNVAEALEEGTKSLKNFESGLPTGFHNPIKKVIKTISDSKRTGNRPSKPPVDPEVIYARSLAIRSIDPSFNFEEHLKYELALFPPSMFKKEGDMRTPTNKSALKNELKVEMSSRNIKTNFSFY